VDEHVQSLTQQHIISTPVLYIESDLLHYYIGINNNWKCSWRGVTLWTAYTVYTIHLLLIWKVCEFLCMALSVSPALVFVCSVISLKSTRNKSIT